MSARLSNLGTDSGWICERWRLASECSGGGCGAPPPTESDRLGLLRTTPLGFRLHTARLRLNPSLLPESGPAQTLPTLRHLRTQNCSRRHLSKDSPEKSTRPH